MRKRRGKKSEPAAKPVCGMCQVELTWRDFAYVAPTAKRCKRCDAIVKIQELRGHYVQVSHGLNRAQRRSFARDMARDLRHRERWQTPRAA